MKSTTMKLLLDSLWCCLLLLTGKTLCDENRPAVVTVEEGTDVILPCSLSTKENIESKLFDWMKVAQRDDDKEVFFYDAGIHYNNGRPGQSEKFKGRVFHFPDELKHGNASIIIRNTKMTDSGEYTCVFPRLQPRQMFHIKLHVALVLKDRSVENIRGAAPKPSIITLDQTDAVVLMQCEVQGTFPKPHLQWQDSAGKVLTAEEPQVTETGGRFNITLKTTVTEKDKYRCVATQEEIGHQTDAEIYLHFSSDDNITELIIGLVAGTLTGILVTLVAVVAVHPYLFRRYLFCRNVKVPAGLSQDPCEYSMRHDMEKCKDMELWKYDDGNTHVT